MLSSKIHIQGTDSFLPFNGTHQKVNGGNASAKSSLFKHSSLFGLRPQQTVSCVTRRR